jgi:hypothetical protein
MLRYYPGMSQRRLRITTYNDGVNTCFTGGDANWGSPK